MGKAIVRVPMAEQAAMVSSVILCDLSGSMKGEPFNRLREILSQMWSEVEETTDLWYFNDVCYRCERPEKLPEPRLGTRLTEAFKALLPLWPAEVILISDGLPEDQAGALDAASRLPGTINAIFVGPESDRIGYEFMAKLASQNGGQAVHRDLHTSCALIAPAIREMLALPSPIAL
jgi:hypothetical protein